MKQIGTLHSFDKLSGDGSIRPQNGGSDLAFESSSAFWGSLLSPDLGQRLSYHLSGKNGRPHAVDVRRTLSLPKMATRKSFTIFRSAAEEAAIKAEHDSWDNEGGHMAATEGRVVHTRGDALPYKVVLKHEDTAETEVSFETMREAEAFIRASTPIPPARSTLRDQEASAL